MIEAVNILIDLLGTHEKVALFLGYTDRNYRNIRRKIERGEEIPPRISSLIQMKLYELQTHKVNNGYAHKTHTP
ncbi:MAG: hypothetical protein ZNDK_1121 [Candidatus Desulfovibrio kirbyi]|jgi:hypothetical protein|uniref:DNA-binding protein n=1 Tax=Candidatus Desulfovibrio kirbyi TaxID=2696086 RepID=A0A6L2R729_9BACT|nr:MAG: hypothetical protein ZNDK_1121 [Candidatus Desulfovibrio kirbyi]